MLASILPESWFAQQHQLVLLLITAVGVLAVMKGADWLVEGAAGLAYKLGMAKVVIGATIVSLGTTSPEAAVSVLAAWEGNPGLALGNGVGSIIADTGLIFGVGAMLCALPADRFVLTRQGWVQFGCAVLLALLCYYAFYRHGDEAALGRWVGLLFLGLLAVYMALSVRWSRAHPHGGRVGEAIDSDAQAAVSDETEGAIRSDLAVWQLIGLGIAGLAVVIGGGEAMVQSAGQLALRWGVPDAVVAATLIAFGTSLPELVVGITSIRKGHPELLVGNVVGADILNVLFVIGAAAVAAPLQVVENGDRIFLQLHLPTLLLMMFLFRGYIFVAMRRGHFYRWMGAPLVAIYVAYVILQYVISAGGSLQHQAGM
jgi:cation:H+ antiporter